MYSLLNCLSGVSFIGFGCGYLFSDRMAAEFTRYGMARYRVVAALLQIAGGLGQLIGLRFPPLGTTASAGLTAMMLVAVGTRVRVGDPALKSTPAVAYLLLCGYLTYAAARR